MSALNIKVGHTQSHTKPVHDLYKDNLANILDNNIDNIVAKTVYTKLRLLK